MPSVCVMDSLTSESSYDTFAFACESSVTKPPNFSLRIQRPRTICVIASDVHFSCPVTASSLSGSDLTELAKMHRYDCPNSTGTGVATYTTYRFSTERFGFKHCSFMYLNNAIGLLWAVLSKRLKLLSVSF